MVHQSGRRQYTLKGDEIVETHINKIVNGIVEHLICEFSPVSVFLSGSLAKGEMSAYSANGKVKYWSDFEIGVVTKNWFKRLKCKKVQQYLSNQYGIDLTLLFFLPRRFENGVATNWAFKHSRLSIEQYELLTAAIFVYGYDFTKDVSNFDVKDISIWEGLRLVFNRVAEIIGAFLVADSDNMNSIVKACNKLLIACGDILLLMNGTYLPLYSKRMECFEKLKTKWINGGAGLLNDEVQTILNSYRVKLYFTESVLVIKNDLITQSINILKKILKFVSSSEMNFDCASAQEFCSKYIRSNKLSSFTRTYGWLENMILLIRNKGKEKGFKLRNYFSNVPVYHIVYMEALEWVLCEFNENWTKSGQRCFEDIELKLKAKNVFEKWRNAVI